MDCGLQHIAYLLTKTGRANHLNTSTPTKQFIAEVGRGRDMITELPDPFLFGNVG
jgi:hypothetical protein